MARPPLLSLPGPRIALWGILVGLVFAALLGVWAESAGRIDFNQAAERPAVRTAFAPGLALLGLLVGAPLGGLVGGLLGRPGLRGALGMGLAALAGGLAGPVAA